VLANEELFRRYQCGDEKARGEILEAYMPLVVNLAHRFCPARSAISLEDLIVEGNLGLLAAIERFQPNFGHQFSTYAHWWVQHYLYRALLHEAHLIRLPKKELTAMRKAYATSQRLFQELERAPSLNEIAYKLDRTLSETEELLQRSSQFSFLGSLDEPESNEEDSITRGDRIPMLESSLEDVVENELLQQSLRLAVERLSEAERVVMELRFGLQDGSRHSYEEIESETSLPRSRIRTLECTALQKLKSLSRA